jgi:hypothetical protein
MKFWPFSRRIQVSHSTLADYWAALHALTERVSDENRAKSKLIEQLREDVEALAAKYERLRGRVYGAGLHKQPSNGVDGIPLGDKAALRRAAGIVAGKPYAHEG